jgi:hypothetical protein
VSDSENPTEKKVARKMYDYVKKNNEGKVKRKPKILREENDEEDMDDRVRYKYSEYTYCDS